MAVAPAYRYDYASAQPERQPSPAVRVVPGSKHTANPTLSSAAVTGVKVLVACLIVFLVISFVRIGLASAAYGTASAASDLRTQIADARTTSESLAVQESLLSSPSNIRTQAEHLSMKAGVATEELALSADPVAIDSAGNLSFSGSVSRLAQQG